MNKTNQNNQTANAQDQQASENPTSQVQQPKTPEHFNSPFLSTPKSPYELGVKVF